MSYWPGLNEYKRESLNAIETIVKFVSIQDDDVYKIKNNKIFRSVYIYYVYIYRYILIYLYIFAFQRNYLCNFATF